MKLGMRHYLPAISRNVQDLVARATWTLDDLLGSVGVVFYRVTDETDKSTAFRLMSEY